MRLPAKKIIMIMLPLAVLWLSGTGMAADQSVGSQNIGNQPQASFGQPSLADIVPLAGKLAARLAALEKRIAGQPDLSIFVEKYDGIDADLKNLARQLERIKGLKVYKYNKLVEIKKGIGQENILYEEISYTINQTMRQLENWRNQWLTEEKKWNEWQSSLHAGGEFEQLKSTFEKATETIDKAIGLVVSRFESMLTVQERAGTIQEKLSALTVELTALIEGERRSTLLDESPPLLSARFFSQLKNGEMWSAIIKGLDEISWADSRTFAQKGWIILCQGVLSLFFIITIYRNRSAIAESERWRFLAERPVSAGLFLGYMSTALIYEYQAAPGTWDLTNTVIAGISFARLVGGLIGASWKSQFINGLMALLISSQVMDQLNFPIPLFRLYTVLAALIGLLFCLYLARTSTQLKESRLYTWSLRLGALFFAVIIIAELWGQKALASHLFISLILSAAITLVFALFMYMIRGGLEWLFRSSPLRRAAVLQSDDTDAIIERLAHFINIVICGLVLLPAFLMVWGVYDSLKEATKGLLELGFNIGSIEITVGLLLSAGAIIYGSILLSWILQKLLVDEVLLKHRLGKGVRLSIARLAHYAIMLIGFLVALSALGFEISKITIMLSALGVGIGFGLQGIVNNFVSGLILLFEQPVRVGDTIEIDGKWAKIRRIGIRATTVQTFDQADLIIPNADLISNQVTNWTLQNRLSRLKILVGVAYGSDVALVMETLIESAKTNPKVTNFPAPKVLFLSFGESALNFELRVIVRDFDDRIEVNSALHQEIDRRFREAKIEIAFPQRDLNLRSADESFKTQSLEANK